MGKDKPGMPWWMESDHGLIELSIVYQLKVRRALKKGRFHSISFMSWFG